HIETITVVCCSPLSPLPPSLEPDLYELFIREDKERANNLASEGADVLRGAANRIVAERKSGRPAESIVEEADRINCDLVVIGASKHGFLERMILGSVAYEVATNAPCSVLIVRPKA
nr:universal stress protein [Fimbriimonadaceae bacterium]